MRIAVYLPALAATAAGGFTFQDDLVEALREVAPEQGHTFLIVSARRPENWDAFDPRFFSFERSPAEWRIKLRRFLTALLPGLDVAHRGSGLSTALDRRLRRHRIDCIWFATPYWAETELPYVFTIWDLQHRVQPWFPEVSRRGRWEFREQWFARGV